jgi:hypothetical protein
MRSKKPTTPKTTRQSPARRARSGPRIPWAPDDLHERIAKRAYEVYEQRILQGPVDDWLQAEWKILGVTTPMNPESPHRGG